MEFYRVNNRKDLNKDVEHMICRYVWQFKINKLNKEYQKEYLTSDYRQLHKKSLTSFNYRNLDLGNYKSDIFFYFAHTYYIFNIYDEQDFPIMHPINISMIEHIKIRTSLPKNYYFNSGHPYLRWDTAFNFKK